MKTLVKFGGEVREIVVKNTFSLFDIIRPRVTYELTSRHKKTPKRRAQRVSRKRLKPKIKAQFIAHLKKSDLKTDVTSGTAVLNVSGSSKAVRDLRDIGYLDLAKVLA